MISNRPASAALLALFLWLTGCSTYRLITPDQVADHGSIRVTLKDGQKAIIHRARLEADSIVGWDDRHDFIGLGAYSLSEVSKIEAPDPNGTSAGEQILGFLFAASLLTYAVIDCNENENCGLFESMSEE